MTVQKEILANSVDQISHNRTWRRIGSTMLAQRTDDFIKHGNNQNLSDTPFVGNRPIQRVEGSLEINEVSFSRDLSWRNLYLGD